MKASPLVHPTFAAVIESLDPAFQKLMGATPRKIADLTPAEPKAGVYVLSEGAQHLYVGRSNSIRARLGRHSRPGATYKMAAFAFRLAREATGHLTPTYKKQGSRAQLMELPDFVAAFDAAKARIRNMDVRLVEESNPTRQALLEIYVATVLDTPYNSFDNH